MNRFLAFLLLFVLNGVCSSVAQAKLVFTPENFDPKSAKLLVVIHGCLQSAESMAIGTGWNQIAEIKGFAVFYPQVPAGSNGVDCWSWFLPENQREDSGQLKSLRDQIQEVKRSLKLKSPKTYLAGISSGGATVAGLMACFPNEFKGGAIHSGPSYGLAQSAAEAERVLKMGPPMTSPTTRCRPRDFNGSLIIVQGSADMVVNPLHARRIIEDFTGPQAEILEASAHVEGWLPYSVREYGAGETTRARLVTVQGLGHAWSGWVTNMRHPLLLGPKGRFPTTLPFFSPLGPSATNLILEFFEETSSRSLEN